EAEALIEVPETGKIEGLAVGADPEPRIAVVEAGAARQRAAIGEAGATVERVGPADRRVIGRTGTLSTTRVIEGRDDHGAAVAARQRRFVLLFAAAIRA